MSSLVIKRDKKGAGVYAARPFSRGETIYVLRGKKVVPKNMHYHNKDFLKKSINPLQIAPRLYLQLSRPSLFFNHSCEPNAGIKGTSTLFALKHIRRGEEITYDYSTTIDESFECVCGSPRCRHAIIDFFGLSRKTQEYYCKRGALPRFILRKYKRWRIEK